MGTFVGLTTIKDGQGAMRDWSFHDGAEYLPSAEAVKMLRPAGE